MKQNNDHSCDFCGKSKEDVEKLIVSDHSAICNDCVELCISILKDEKVKKFPADEKNKIYNPVLIKDFLYLSQFPENILTISSPKLK